MNYPQLNFMYYILDDKTIFDFIFFLSNKNKQKKTLKLDPGNTFNLDLLIKCKSWKKPGHKGKCYLKIEVGITETKDSFKNRGYWFCFCSVSSLVAKQLLALNFY